MALKGTTKIELTNVKTGEVEVIEKDNLVTNAVNDILSMNSGGFLFRDYKAIADGELQVAFADKFFPICPNLIGGILLYNDALEEDPDKYFADQSNPVIGYSSNDVNTGEDTKRGSMNQTESGPLDDDSGYRFVFDFGTSQANGTISAVGLTSPYGGCGHGVHNSNADEYRKPVLCVYDYYKQYSGAYTNSVRIRPITNIVSIDPDNNLGYFAYVSAEKSIVVGKVRMDLTSIGLRRYFPEGMTVVETNIIETKNFASVMYTNHFFNGTLIDGGDGYIWGFQHDGNSAGNSSGNATVLWVKISKADWSFEEGSWTIAAQLGSFGKVGDFSNDSYCVIENNAVIKDDKLYVLKYASNYAEAYVDTVYEISFSNITDVKEYKSTVGWRRVSPYDGSITRLNCINGKVRTYNQYIDGDVLNAGYLRSPSNTSFIDSPSQKMCIDRCTKPNLVYGPYIFAFGTTVTTKSYYNYVSIYLQMCFLATINNLPTPVEKTADKTMKITYIIREE